MGVVFRNLQPPHSRSAPDDAGNSTMSLGVKHISAALAEGITLLQKIKLRTIN